MAEKKQYLGIVYISDEGEGIVDIVSEEHEAPLRETQAVFKPAPGRA